MEASQLRKTLKAIADEHWATNKQPVLLSALSKLLTEKLGRDYKDTLAGKNLKTYIKNTHSESGYKLVEHPTQQAKLGLVPADVSFHFEAVSPSDVLKDISAADAQAFARVLSALTEEERKTVMLPATLVARLLAAR